MATKKSELPILTRAESELMALFWRHGAMTVSALHERLSDRAYTSLATLVKILEQKGYVKKTRADRAFVYRPARPRQQVLGGMVREFIDRVFDGASRPMLLHLVKETRLSDKERKALLRAIEEVEE